jgi:hypothetical protein
MSVLAILEQIGATQMGLSHSIQQGEQNSCETRKSTKFSIALQVAAAKA